MKIDVVEEAGRTVLVPEGRIDTNNAAQFQGTLLRAFQSTAVIAVDLGKVPYMSSAGLRVLLIGHKTAASKRGKFSIRNVTATVRDTLEVTGFADALHIEE